MTSINYNEFQPGQGVSAPALNENFSLTNSAIETLEATLNSTVTSLTSTVQLKADKNGSSAQKFNVANATENTQAVNLSQLNDATSTLSPTGTVIWFAGVNVPEGYLLCNGSAVSRTVYSDLFDVIGVKFGAGDALTTFNLPKLTDNRFIEGSASAGTQRDAGLPNITGVGPRISEEIWNGVGASGAIYFNNSYTGSGGENGDREFRNQVGWNFDASKSNSIYGGSSTVQPKSLTLLPCIKY